VLLATKSQSKSFSGADVPFAKALLADYQWSYTKSSVSGLLLDPFSWKMTDDGKEDEAARTDDAVKHLSTNLSLSKIFNGEEDSEVEIVNVCQTHMWPLTYNHNTARGKTDLAVREKSAAVPPNFLSFAMGLAELKTSSASIKEAQVVFELVSASRMSKYEQGVVILATDLNTKWWVAWFDDVNRIIIRTFLGGTVALSFFKDKLENAFMRASTLKQQLTAKQLPSISKDHGGNSGYGGGAGGDSSGNGGGGGGGGDGGGNTTGGNSSGGILSVTASAGASNVATHSLEQDIVGCLPDAEVETFNEHTFRHMLARELHLQTGCTVAF
jgi:hypothetical protein